MKLYSISRDILREVEAQQAALAAAQSQSAVTPNSSRRPSNTDVNVPITRETADVANRSTTDMKTAVQTTTVDGTPTKRVGTMNYTNSQEITVEQWWCVTVTWIRLFIKEDTFVDIRYCLGTPCIYLHIYDEDDIPTALPVMPTLNRYWWFSATLR